MKKSSTKAPLRSTLKKSYTTNQRTLHKRSPIPSIKVYRTSENAVVAHKSLNSFHFQSSSSSSSSIKLINTSTPQYQNITNFQYINSSTTSFPNILYTQPLQTIKQFPLFLIPSAHFSTSHRGSNHQSSKIESNPKFHLHSLNFNPHHNQINQPSHDHKTISRSPTSTNAPSTNNSDESLSTSESKVPSLNKIIASSGHSSRRGANDLITSGRVLINDKPITTPTYKIEPTDTVTLILPDGVRRVIHSPQSSCLNDQSRVIVFHKPPGYLCSHPQTPPSNSSSSTNDPQGAESIFNVLPAEYRKFLYIGRLDAPSSGLLLLTNKGDIVNKIAHPSKMIEKEYIVTTKNEIKLEFYHRMLNGILDENNDEILQAQSISQIPRESYLPTLPPRSQHHSLDSQHNSIKSYSFVLTKGYKREVRRLVATQPHNQVLSLHRVRVGNICLGDLPTGHIRELSEMEINSLLNDAQMDSGSLFDFNQNHLIDMGGKNVRQQGNYLPTTGTNFQFSKLSAESKMPAITDPFAKHPHRSQKV